MNDFTGLDALNGVHERREKWTVVFDAVLLHMDDDDAERQFRKIVFELKASVDGDENVKLSLGLGGKFGVRQRAPLGFGNGQDFMVGERLPETRIDALV